MAKSNDYNLLIQHLARLKADFERKGIIDTNLENAWFYAGCILAEANKREKNNEI